MRTTTSPSRAMRRPLWLVVAAVTALAALVTTTAVAEAATGIDIAGYQHPGGAAINWAAVRASGKSFVYIKATEGAGFTNPWFARDAAGAKKAGVYAGAYHFARPSGAAGSAAAQARYFVSHAGSFRARGDLPPMLDLETSGGLSPSRLQAWVSTWLRTVRSLTGRTPVIYVSPTFWRTRMGDSTAFHGYPLFLAHYQVNWPDIPGGWTRWTFWQHSDLGRAGGIKGLVDLDTFSGTDAQLAAMAGTRPDLRTSISASTSASAVVRGTRVNLWGTLSGGGGDPRWQPVSLYARTQGSSTWRLVASTHTSGTGFYSFSTVPSTTATYAVRFWPATGLATTASPARPVTVVGAVTSTALSLRASAASIKSGVTVTVSGALSIGGRGVAAQPVTVYARTAGTTAWRAVARTTTDAAGRYAVTQRPGRSTAYAARYAGVPALRASASASRWVTVVTVRPTALSLAGSPTQVLRGQPATVSGLLASGGTGVAGQPVTVYARTLGTTAWRTVGRVTTASTGRWALRVTPGASTAYAARFAGTSSYKPSASPSRVVSVVSALSTRLTLAASAGTVRSGTAVTLRGALSSMQGPLAGRWVTVYGRAAGATGWTRLGQVRTTASGGWALAVRPTRSTSYAAGFAGGPGLARAQAPARTVTVTR